MRQLFEGVFEDREGKRRLLYTRNLIKGAHFNEALKAEGGIEYRNWDARRSKAAAAIMRGMKEFPVRKGTVVLYLGASHGVTPSFFSDIVVDGFIFAVEFSPRVARELVYVAEARKNIAPILADASRPEEYLDKAARCDVLYQDIAQKNQVGIFAKNAALFLKKDGYGMLALKARSIDVTKKPSIIFDEARRELQKNFEIIDYRTLEPFEKDHAFFLVRKKQ